MPQQAGNRKSMPSVIVVYDLLKVLGWDLPLAGAIKESQSHGRFRRTDPMASILDE
ncbi:hypothetical protein GGE45_002627 [Rhizobium aethiopicum]|uniref:Uncharacterized protein n=1 Tax=Rhizobium aethiopicum TaxID=1138170 RepID=A0A7W6Q6F7_9HYPH|nr:hypothetical protein [Rhizobium aethiopicum]MBB4189964.1 hypothetical protein [Rhizobium aethiopicum]MBB4580297.1 hypothetical protein [Rhizobium aethiopicum]